MKRINVLLVVSIFLLTAVAGFAQDKEVPAELKTEEYLSQFVGAFVDLDGGEGEFKLTEKKTLQAVSPSGTSMDLEPIAKDEFEVIGIPNAVFKFSRNDEGKVVSAKLHLPDGSVIEMNSK